MKLALKFPHVLVARTFSKAYSLCFQRVGYFVGHRELIAALHKIRDSYNVNGLGQIAAVATLDDLKYYRANFKKIIATREWLSRELTKLGFRVFPSRTNFILVQPPLFPAEDWLRKLRDRKILVRWFNSPEVKNYLRITIGTPAEAAALVKAAGKLSSVTSRDAFSVKIVKLSLRIVPAVSAKRAGVYLEFYGLKQAPFDLTPNPRFLFHSGKHREALNHLLYGIRERKGFVQLTGEVGAGKTTLCRAMLEQLDGQFSTALILNPGAERGRIDEGHRDGIRPAGEQPRSGPARHAVAAINEFLSETGRAGPGIRAHH